MEEKEVVKKKRRRRKKTKETKDAREDRSIPTSVSVPTSQTEISQTEISTQQSSSVPESSETGTEEEEGEEQKGAGDFVKTKEEEKEMPLGQLRFLTSRGFASEIMMQREWPNFQVFVHRQGKKRNIH